MDNGLTKTDYHRFVIQIMLIRCDNRVRESIDKCDLEIMDKDKDKKLKENMSEDLPEQDLPMDEGAAEKPKDETVPPKTNRQRMLERYLKDHPDLNTEDDEALYGLANEDYDNLSSRLNDYKTNEERLAKLMSSDGRGAEFLLNWSLGKDPLVSMMELFGDELQEALEDPEKIPELAKANKAYHDRLAKSKELEEQYQKNMEANPAIIDEAKESLGLSDDQMSKVLDRLIGIAEDVISGKLTPENLELVAKGVTFDQSISEATHEGEVKGRNAQISERLKKRDMGDGIPKDIGGGMSVRKTGNGLPTALDFEPKKSIWEK